MGSESTRAGAPIAVAPGNGATEQPSGAAPWPTARAAEGKADFTRQRLVSLDAYRGLIMVALAFNGFGLYQTATLHRQAQGDTLLWRALRYQFSHTEWTGCSFWDLIQPSFMFMVGTAMAFSYARRRQAGQSWPRMLGHAAWRSVVLVLLGVFLMSSGAPQTNWTFVNVLTQIGLGYVFLFLLWGRPPAVQALTAAIILGSTWLLYQQYPHAGIDVARGAPEVGVSQHWAQRYLADVPPAWHKNANVGHAVDLDFLNLFPRREPFRFNEGGYQTLNFLPSLATMLFGLMCGELLRSARSARFKLQALVLAGLAGLVVGQALDLAEICPLVKRIWTPAWALFSTGWCCLILAAFYAVVDVLGYRRWAFPLVVVGLNSIAIYCMGMTLRGWTARMLQTHLGPEVFRVFGPLWEPTVQTVLVGLVFWVACWWMYRQRIFIRI